MTPDDLLTYWPALALGAAVLIAAIGAHFFFNRQPSAAELERRRREMINALGKMGDATIAEFQAPLLSYTYHVRGIEYLATQDLSDLETYLPSDQASLMGPVSIKYDPRNPANSIVVSERWSGLRKQTKVNS